MRILHVILSSGFAGSERSTAESCNSQHAAGHHVGLVIRNGHRSETGASIVDAVDAAIPRIVIPDRWFSRLALERAIREFRPDVIHCHLRRAVRLVARSNTDVSTVATLHITWNGSYFSKMDGVICNARWQLKDIPAGYKGLVFKAHNSLDPQRTPSTERIAELRSELGVDPEGLLVGGVGRMTHKKGWDVLIRAFREASLPDTARLVIIGDGRLRQRLSQQAAGDSRISMPGYRRDIKMLYPAMDVFVCPSRFEPLPRVMLEAMDAGTPVIASAADGCKELVDDYGGDLFEIDDVGRLRALLSEAGKSRPPRRRPDLSVHYVETTTATMLAFYSELIERRLGLADISRG